VRARVKGFTTFEAQAVFRRSFVSYYVISNFDLNVCVNSSLVFGDFVRIFGYLQQLGSGGVPFTMSMILGLGWCIHHACRNGGVCFGGGIMISKHAARFTAQMDGRCKEDGGDEKKC
jgi:hypothetical protein